MSACNVYKHIFIYIYISYKFLHVGDPTPVERKNYVCGKREQREPIRPITGATKWWLRVGKVV